MKCPKCGYDNKDGLDHCDLCKEIIAKPPDLSRPTSTRYQPSRSMEEPTGPEKPIISSPSDGKIDNMEAIKFGWEGMKEHFWLFMGIVVTAIGIYGIEWIIQLAVTGGSKHMTFPGFILQLLFAFLNMVIFTLGYNKLCLKIVDGEAPEYGDLFSCFHLGLPFILTSIIIGLMFAPAAILMFVFALMLKKAVILGILGIMAIILGLTIMAIRFVFIAYLIVDKELPAMECVKTSWRMTEGTIWDMSVFFLWLSLVVLAGVLCLFVGLVAAIPTMSVATAYYYRQLSKRI